MFNAAAFCFIASSAAAARASNFLPLSGFAGLAAHATSPPEARLNAIKIPNRAMCLFISISLQRRTQSRNLVRQERILLCVLEVLLSGDPAGEPPEPPMRGLRPQRLPTNNIDGSRNLLWRRGRGSWRRSRRLGLLLAWDRSRRCLFLYLL